MEEDGRKKYRRSEIEMNIQSKFHLTPVSSFLAQHAAHLRL